MWLKDNRDTQKNKGNILIRKLNMNSTTILALAAITAVSSLSVHASAVSTKSLNIDTMVDKTSNFSGSFAMTGNSMVQDVGEVVGNKYFGDLNLNYSKENSYNVDLKTRFNDADAFMFSVTEAYTRFELAKGELFIGRKLLDWSDLDANWGFGRINNRTNFDFFEPGAEGLTGALYNTRIGNFLISGFASYVYIPELNPGQKYDKDKGTITCNNPWCRPVPADNSDTGTTYRIAYDLNMPEISDIVFNYSAGLNLGYDFGKAQVKGFYMRKPENQISVSASINLNTDGDEAFLDAQLFPEIYYHDVVGANLDVDVSDNFVISGSYISYDPESQPEGTEQILRYLKRKTLKKKEEYVGLGGVYTKSKYQAKLNYIARVSEFEVEQDKLVEYPRWNQAVHASFVSKVTAKLGLGLDLKYDMLTEDRLGMVKVNYAFRENVQVGAGVSVIGENSEKESYWSEFSNNDSVYGSLKYIF